MAKAFTEADVDERGYICAERKDLVLSQLPWQRHGLQQTASGYGMRLTTEWKINYGGKLRRLYATCISNCATVWFIDKGRKIVIR